MSGDLYSLVASLELLISRRETTKDYDVCFGYLLCALQNGGYRDTYKRYFRVFCEGEEPMDVREYVRCGGGVVQVYVP